MNCWGQQNTEDAKKKAISVHAARMTGRTSAGLGPPSYPESKTSPPNLAVRRGRKRGWELATLSFPVPTLGALDGCRLPDAILHGKRSVRPRSRAVERLAVARF